jgi:hypothetical protein
MTMTEQSLDRASTPLRWHVDPVAVAGTMRWAARQPDALAADLDGMASYFPHWLLVGSQAGRTVHCHSCSTPGVPIAGKIRCPACHTALSADGLVWVGHLPALAHPDARFVGKQAALHAAGFDEIHVAGLDYVLVPISVAYPTEWPNVEPIVRYAPRWLDAAGLPRASAAHHLIGNAQACLFAWSQWQAMPIHSVLQQRVVNHVASLLKIIAGMAPNQAFIGRIDHGAWHPSAGDDIVDER